MGIYESLGVRPLINVSARLTKFGGSLMPPEVLAAMNDAAANYVDIFALQKAAGDRIAQLTRNEAAYVATGAAAGIFVSTIAIAVGADPVAMARFMETRQLPRDEVIIHRNHRIPYEPAARLAGAKLVEIGNVFLTTPAELEAAITERTAYVFYVPGAHIGRGVLPLETVVEIAHAHGVPVIVDAAAQLPPAENLWKYTRDLGADLAVFSGGKDLRGPQASGFVVGRADLIEAMRLHGAPNQRFGRPMKVGKEEMCGLVAAIERYLTMDHDARIAEWETIVAEWIAAGSGIPGVRAYRGFPNEAGQPTPRALFEIDPAVAGFSAADAIARLLTGDPAIAAGTDAGPNIVACSPDVLDGADPAIITAALKSVLSGALAPA
jgi:L-seryl-tRNA(Ser) seleniumtransferase